MDIPRNGQEPLGFSVPRPAQACTKFIDAGEKPVYIGTAPRMLRLWWRLGQFLDAG